MKKLGASDFAAAAGISPWVSRIRLWELYTGRRKRDPMTSRMKWGKDHEWRAVQAAEAATGLVFTETGENQRNHQLENISATPDGRCGEVGLEVKCPEKPYESVPGHYLCQCQGQVLVCGFTTVIFGCWGTNFERFWEISSSTEYCDMLLPLLDEFLGYLRNDEKPPRLKKKPVFPEVTIKEI